MISDLIIKVEYQDLIYVLTVDTEVPLRVDMSAVESQELGKFFGIGSQTFSLPGSNYNSQFFQNAFDVSVDDVPGFYNTLPCSVILNGETLLIGSLQLVQVVTSDDGYTTYQVQVVDKVLQFEELLSSRLVREADWSAYTHTLTSQSVIDSWNDNLLGGSVFYPLAEYGRTDEETYPQLPRIQFDPSINNLGNVNSVFTPLQPQQLLPAIKVKDCLDVIFDQVGFVYTGSFTETDDFNNLYVLPKGQEAVGPVVSGDNTAVFVALQNTNQSITYGVNQYYTVSASVESYDPQNVYDPTTSTYSAVGSGVYEFAGQIQFFNPVMPDPFTTARVTLALELNGTIFDESYIDLTQANGVGPYILQVGSSNNIPGSVDAKLKVKYEFVISAGNPPQTMTLLYGGTRFECTEAPINYNGATINMGLQFQPETKSVDFIKGLLQQFNLVMTPEPDNKSVIRIDQFDDWIRAGEIKDWTDKYDTSKRIQISHTVSELEREILLKSADDTDRFSTTTIEQQPGYQYGTLRLLADNTISQGDKIIGDYFAPVTLGSPLIYNQSGSDGSYTFNLDLSDRNVHPHLYKLDNNAQKAYMFKPRLGYKVSNQLQSGTSIFLGLPNAQGSDADLTIITGSYSTLSNTSELPVVTDSTNDLHFNNTYGLFTGAGLNLKAGISNFNRYWKTYLDSLYWEGAKKVVLDLYFEPYEYKQIKLNDRILIKNQAYRINKISGFNVSHRDVVTVELIRLYPAYWQVQLNGGVPPVELYTMGRTTAIGVADITDLTTQQLINDQCGSCIGSESEEYFKVLNIPMQVGDQLYNFNETPNTTYTGNLPSQWTAINTSITACSGSKITIPYIYELTNGIVTNVDAQDIDCTVPENQPEVITYSTLASTTTTLTIGGSVTNEGVPAYAAKGFYWVEGTGTPTASDNIRSFPYTGTGDYQTTLTGLTQGTQYSFRAWATNTVGTSLGNVQTTITLLEGYYQLQDCSTLSTNHRTSQTIQEITLGNGDRVTSGGVTYQVVGSTNDQNIPSHFVTDTGLQGCPATERYYNYEDCATGNTITGVAYWPSGTSLTNGNSFYQGECFRITTETTGPNFNDFDLTGYTIYNDCNACNTDSEFPPSVTTNSPVNETTTSITMAGTVTNVGDPNYTVKGFVWVQGTGTPTMSDNVETVSGTSAGLYTKVVSGLSPGTQYTYRAYATNSVNTVYGASLTTITNLVGYYQLQDCSTLSTNHRSQQTIEEITLGTNDRVTSGGVTYKVVGSTNNTGIPSHFVTDTGLQGCPATERFYNYEECDGGPISGVARWPFGTSLTNGNSFFSGQCFRITTETTSSGLDFDLTGYTIYNDCTDCVNANQPSPTPTPTPTPTPPPSGFANTIYNDGSTGWSVDIEACINVGFPVTIYTAENATVLQIAENGYQMFTNSGLTNPFNGGNLYYKSVSGANDGIYMQINSSGVTTSDGSCPSKIYARFVTCGDPSGAVIQVESDFAIDQSAVLLDNGVCYEYLNSGGNGVDGDISTFTTYNDCATCEASLTQTYWLLNNCTTGVINQRSFLPTGSYSVTGGDRVSDSGGNTFYTIQGTTTDQNINGLTIIDTGLVGCPPQCNSDLVYVSTVSAFDAHCTQTVLRTVYHNGDTFANATVVYGTSSDCSTALTSQRWYSDGFFTWYWDGFSKTLISNPPCN